MLLTTKTWRKIRHTDGTEGDEQIVEEKTKHQTDCQPTSARASGTNAPK